MSAVQPCSIFLITCCLFRASDDCVFSVCDCILFNFKPLFIYTLSDSSRWHHAFVSISDGTSMYINEGLVGSTWPQKEFRVWCQNKVLEMNKEYLKWQWWGWWKCGVYPEIVAIWGFCLSNGRPEKIGFHLEINLRIAIKERIIISREEEVLGVGRLGLHFHWVMSI